MGGQINPKILGATVVGFALVALAYTVSNFGESDFPQQPANLQESTPPQRLAITTTDSDNNGIEDWRDIFVDNSTVVNSVAPSIYQAPDTLTGRTSVEFIEGIINSKLYSPIAPNSDEIVSRTIQSIESTSAPKLLNSRDIEIIENWDNQDIINYANTVASNIYRHSDGNLDSEIEIFGKILNQIGNKEENLLALQKKADSYQNLLNDTLKVPVPKILAKEHLDLVNTYKAIFEDIDGMKRMADDPLLALIHLKRYPDDVEGMHLSLQNIYLALTDSPVSFTKEDPALLFIIFSPDYKLNI